MVCELSSSRSHSSLELLTIASVGHLSLPEERRGILNRVSSENCDSYSAHRSGLVSFPDRQAAEAPMEGFSPREAAVGLRFFEPRGDNGADRRCGVFDFPHGSLPEGIFAYNQAIDGVVERSATDPDSLNEALRKAFFLPPVGQMFSRWPCNGLPFYCDGRLSRGLQEHLWRWPVPYLHIHTCVSGVCGAVAPVVGGDEGAETSPFTGTIGWQTIEQHNALPRSLDYLADIIRAHHRRHHRRHRSANLAMPALRSSGIRIVLIHDRPSFDVGDCDPPIPAIECEDDAPVTSTRANAPHFLVANQL